MLVDREKSSNGQRRRTITTTVYIYIYIYSIARVSMYSFGIYYQSGSLANYTRLQVMSPKAAQATCSCNEEAESLWSIYGASYLVLCTVVFYDSAP